MSLSRDEILGRVFPPVGKVDVPELGGEVFIAGVSVAAGDTIRHLGVAGAATNKAAQAIRDAVMGAIADLPDAVVGAGADKAQLLQLIGDRAAAVAETLPLKGEEAADVGFGVRIAILFACDAEGRLLFTLADAPALNELPIKAINTISEAALDLNGLSPKGKEEAKNGSGATGDGDSVSGSPSHSEELSPS